MVGEEVVTHIQFADNMILFTSTRWNEIVTLKRTWNEIVTLHRILRCFQIILSLKINLSKSPGWEWVVWSKPSDIGR